MLNEKNAVITGGSRGIGAACAIALAKEGADIALVATGFGDEAKETVSQIESLGRVCRFYECDIKDPESVKEVSSKILEDFSHIDILVNNAGITKDSLAIQMKDEDFAAVLSVNLTGTFNMTKAFLRPMMKQKGGRIINISSVVGLMGNAGQANYAASKAGIIGLTKSLAREYASKNITVNAVAPGYILTQMTGALSEEASAQMLNSIPVKRYGTPGDVANLVCFLAQDATSYITGEVIKVDGGMYI